jgi:hypothetical protein
MSSFFQAMNIIVEKDWVVVIAAGSRADLAGLSISSFTHFLLEAARDQHPSIKR